MDLDHPKLKLHEYLKTEIQKQINNPDVKLDAFIVSVTPFSTLRKMHPGYPITIEELAEDKHILFQDKEEKVQKAEYVEKLFEIAMQN